MAYSPEAAKLRRCRAVCADGGPCMAWAIWGQPDGLCARPTPAAPGARGLGADRPGPGHSTLDMSHVRVRHTLGRTVLVVGFAGGRSGRSTGSQRLPAPTP